jgi:hypothetical protein
MVVTDHGLLVTADSSGRPFNAYVTHFEDSCRYCGEVLTGTSRVDAYILDAVAGYPEQVARFRALEDDAYRKRFQRTLEEHERKHWVRRLARWLKLQLLG